MELISNWLSLWGMLDVIILMITMVIVILGGFFASKDLGWIPFLFMVFVFFLLPSFVLFTLFQYGDPPMQGPIFFFAEGAVFICWFIFALINPPF